MNAFCFEFVRLLNLTYFGNSLILPIKKGVFSLLLRFIRATALGEATVVLTGDVLICGLPIAGTVLANASVASEVDRGGHSLWSLLAFQVPEGQPMVLLEFAWLVALLVDLVAQAAVGLFPADG